MSDFKTKDVLEVIVEIALSTKHMDLMLNERYIHHFFSHLWQDRHTSLNLTKDDKTTITLHPEWPTSNKWNELKYGRYKYNKEKRIYEPNASGSAGFIDFAIGDYKEPHIGIEFTLKYGWSHEDIAYDFLKLLDKRNPFKASISFNIIFREKSLVKGERLSKFKEKMKKAYSEAAGRLNTDMCDESREVYLIITEIDKDNNRRHWHYDRTSSIFKEGLPVIA